MIGEGRWTTSDRATELIWWGLRSTDFKPVLAGAGGGAFLVALVAGQAERDPGRLAAALLPVIALLAIGVSAAVDEAPAALLAGSPTTTRRRLAHRLVGVGAVAIVAAGGLTLTVARLGSGPRPWTGSTVARDALILTLLSLGVAAQANRWWPHVPAGLASAAVLGLLGMAWGAPRPASSTRVSVGLPGWAYGAAGLMAGVGLLLLATRDPASGLPLTRRPHRARPVSPAIGSPPADHSPAR